MTTAIPDRMETFEEVGGTWEVLLCIMQAAFPQADSKWLGVPNPRS
ncbi:MAG: hypothetical protein ACXACI_10045 [Candidatus Hodarchaeales archaeon]